MTEIFLAVNYICQTQKHFEIQISLRWADGFPYVAFLSLAQINVSESIISWFYNLSELQ